MYALERGNLGDTYAFVLRLRKWLEAPQFAGASNSLAASLTREFMHDRGRLVTQLPLDVPDERDHLDEASSRRSNGPCQPSTR